MDNRRIIPLSVRLIQDKKPDDLYYIKSTLHYFRNNIVGTVNKICGAVWQAFSMEGMSFREFLRGVIPLAFSGVAYCLGHIASTKMSQHFYGDDEHDFIYKFLLGSAILAFSAAHRVTEHRMKSYFQFSVYAALEASSIIALYYSTYRASRAWVSDYVSEDSSLITGLVTSAFLMPAALIALVNKNQERAVKKLYEKGAQRFDTATISSGITWVGNTFFQAIHIFINEVLTLARLFQVFLITDNIFNANHWLKKLRNIPAFLLDVLQSMMAQLVEEIGKVKADRLYNMTSEKVLRWQNGKPTFFRIPRHRLRQGDLVVCDKNFNQESVSVSGRVVALKKNLDGTFIPSLEAKKFTITLEAKNGEAEWLSLKTEEFLPESKALALRDISRQRQPAMLRGTQVVLPGDNFFVQIAKEKEQSLYSGYRKTSIIDEIMDEHRKRCVKLAVVSSLLLASFVKLVSSGPVSMVSLTLRLLFNLFQMMIPFSLTFLRGLVNSRIMTELNQPTTMMPLKLVDALRVGDFCNVLGGYYADKYPKGATIVSDKTGTLTAKMKAMGCWVPGMAANVQEAMRLEEKRSECYLPTERSDFLAFFEGFASAYTNSSEELEPEEAVMLKMFKRELKDEHCLQIEELDKDHFRKTIMLGDKKKTIETIHLGLHHTLGGRLTLVVDGEKKYLVFCGIPREVWKDMPLYASYYGMRPREAVLSRDWSVARTPISEELFHQLKVLSVAGKKTEIESRIISEKAVLHNFRHIGTCIIDNAVKKGAEHFIARCDQAGVPVFIATGDNAKASANIAKVLCPNHAKNIFTIRALDELKEIRREYPPNSTVIFSEINADILRVFDALMEIKKEDRPVIIFSEMTEEGKGILAQHLKKKGYFVAANGDGGNDVQMMQHAHVTFVHRTAKGTYAPNVGQFANLDDEQLRKLNQSDKSFYELFDIHQVKSQFIQIFSPLTNAQPMSAIALLLKTAKMSFELFEMLGVPGITAMPYYRSSEKYVGFFFNRIQLLT